MKQIFIMLLLRFLINNNMRKCMWTPCERSTYVLILVKRGMITRIALWSVFSLCIVYQFLHNVKVCTNQGGGLLQKFGISSIVKAEIAEALWDKSLQDEEQTTLPESPAGSGLTHIGLWLLIIETQLSAGPQKSSCIQPWQRSYTGISKHSEIFVNSNIIFPKHVTN